MTLCKNVLDQIKAEDLKPKSKWIFVLKECVFWLVHLLAFVMGTLSVAVMMYAATKADFDLFSYLGARGIKQTLSWVTLLWLGLVLTLVIVSAIGLRHTKHGYRYSYLFLWGGNIGLSVLFGALLFWLGLGEKMDHAFAGYSFYKGAHRAHIEHWIQPEAGRLGGEIIQKDIEAQTWQVREMTDQIWTVDISQVPGQRILGLPEGRMVRFVGTADMETLSFSAEMALPWKGKMDKKWLKHQMEKGHIKRKDLEKMRHKLGDRIQDLPPEQRRELKQKMREHFEQEIR